jgi:hypothetical protein
MDDPLIDPRAPAGRKQRDVESERRQRAIEQFVNHHPLARLYMAISYLDYARDEKHWFQVGFWANHLCSAYANLDEDYKGFLTYNEDGEALLPNPPDPLGERSTFAWIAYVASLRAAKSRWQRLREAVAGWITDGWGADFLPTVLRPVSSWDYTEPPF